MEAEDKGSTVGKYIVVFGMVAVVAFMVGMKWQRYLYQNACTELNGTQNRDGYPVCLVERLPQNDQ